MGEIKLGVYVANDIKPESWLNEKRFEAFRKAYSYAGSQSRAIPAMAKISPEEAYFLYESLKDGEARYHNKKEEK